MPAVPPRAFAGRGATMPETTTMARTSTAAPAAMGATRARPETTPCRRPENKGRRTPRNLGPPPSEATSPRLLEPPRTALPGARRLTRGEGLPESEPARGICIDVACAGRFAEERISRDPPCGRRAPAAPLPRVVTRETRPTMPTIRDAMSSTRGLVRRRREGLAPRGSATPAPRCRRALLAEGPLARVPAGLLPSKPLRSRPPLSPCPLMLPSS